MEKVYIIIAENGEHGLWSVTAYSTKDQAKDNLKSIAETVANKLGKGEFHGKSPKIELYEESAYIDNEESIVNIEIHETVLINNTNMVMS